MLPLPEFISETLAGILAGVQQAQASAKDTGGIVSPQMAGSSVQIVEFDVEVNTVEGSGNRSGLGIFVGAVTAGTQGQTDTRSTSVGRIRFKVPVKLPTHGPEAERFRTSKALA